MPDTRYTYNVNLDDLTTSHSLAVLLVPPGSSVLDVGAADGSVARPLAARGCRVWAIEADAQAAAKARGACERVIVGDVEELDLEVVLEGRKFDVVLLLDVLEHLREPLVTLQRARDLLASGGRIIASIPNVAHGAVRVSLMLGAFTYTESGLLDRTHLHFFDRRSAEALLTDAGLRIVERLRVVRGLSETEIPIDPSVVPPQMIQLLETDPEATTFQFVLVGVRSEGERVPEGVSLAERLQRRTEELQAQYRQLEEYARSLERQHREEAGITAQRNEVQLELQARVRELAQSHLELQHLREDLVVKEAFIVELREGADRASVEAKASVAEITAQRTELQSELEARMRELAQSHLELRHVRADLVVKEAFIVELREGADRASVEMEGSVTALRHKDAVIQQLQGEAAARTDAERQLNATRVALTETREALTETQEDLTETQEALTETQEALNRLRVFANSSGFRIVTRMTGWLTRYPRMYKSIRHLARRVVGLGTPDSRMS